jgi:uncharacterized protein YjgD (DUF1641 family)
MRDDALLKRTRAHQPTSNGDILDCLRDPQVRQTITVQHVIARPAVGRFDAWVPA